MRSLQPWTNRRIRCCAHLTKVYLSVKSKERKGWNIRLEIKLNLAFMIIIIFIKQMTFSKRPVYDMQKWSLQIIFNTITSLCHCIANDFQLGLCAHNLLFWDDSLLCLSRLVVVSSSTGDEGPSRLRIVVVLIMTSSNGNIFRVTGPVCG